MLTHQAESRTPKDIRILFDRALEWYIENIDTLPENVRSSFKKIHHIITVNVNIRDVYVYASTEMDTIGNYTKDSRWVEYATAITDYYTLTAENKMPKGCTG